MSEARRSLKCAACAAIAWTDGAVPESCPACGAIWRLMGVAVLEVEADGLPYVKPDGASILKDSD